MIEYISNDVSEFEKSVIQKTSKFEVVKINADGVTVVEIPPKKLEEAINESVLELPE